MPDVLHVKNPAEAVQDPELTKLLDRIKELTANALAYGDFGNLVHTGSLNPSMDITHIPLAYDFGTRKDPKESLKIEQSNDRNIERMLSKFLSLIPVQAIIADIKKLKKKADQLKLSTTLYNLFEDWANNTISKSKGLQGIRISPNKKYLIREILWAIQKAPDTNSGSESIDFTPRFEPGNDDLLKSKFGLIPESEPFYLALHCVQTTSPITLGERIQESEGSFKPEGFASLEFATSNLPWINIPIRSIHQSRIWLKDGEWKILVSRTDNSSENLISKLKIGVYRGTPDTHYQDSFNLMVRDVTVATAENLARYLHDKLQYINGYLKEGDIEFEEIKQDISNIIEGKSIS